jgi:hypothetical protein
MFGPVHVIAWTAELPARLPPTEGRETTFTIAAWQVRGMGRGGENALPARFAGQLEMREDRAAVVAATLGDSVLVQAPVAPGQEEVTLVVDPQHMRSLLAGVRLQVVDAATNRPLPDAKVTLNAPQSWSQPVAVDAEGRFERSALRAGTYNLIVAGGDGRVAPMVAVDLAPGVVTDLGALPVTTAVDLHVRITGAAENERCTATLTALDGPAQPGLSPRSERMLVAKGELRSQVAPGRYRLRLTAGTGGALVDLDTRRLAGEPLVVALQPEPALAIDPSQLDEPARLVLRGSNGAVLHDRWVTWKSVFRVQLPAGDYRVTVQRLRGDPREESLTLPAEGATYVVR